MQIHNIKSKTRRKKAKRIGRGATRGTYSGKGIKGQKARAGRKMRPEMRDIIKKIHKKRGYRFASIEDKPAVVNLSALSVFAEGALVSPRVLVEKKIVQQKSGSAPKVKILGNGELMKKLVFSECMFSGEARKKIEKSGGTIKV